MRQLRWVACVILLSSCSNLTNNRVYTNQEESNIEITIEQDAVRYVKPDYNTGALVIDLAYEAVLN